ncbi:hypothetical protein PHMEG_0006314 [Phytophthora megakarya]|uniref:Uncharacterized protein n=1 Tax=Phytophthora megakarya TaxID=4795 RepID=A0A225WQU1_9STRA|nr:hypothetical protein PHMEG_0006314 [Phytophthora megakarya]
MGELSDEENSDVGGVELSEAVCNTVAQSKKAMATMKKLGWEYGKLIMYNISNPEKFGPDPIYANLYAGEHGPSDSVLAVGADRLALLFTSCRRNCGLKLPHRATAITRSRFHSEQGRSGRNSAVMVLLLLFGQLARVPDIDPWEVLRVIAPLIPRMLPPVRKGIAAH